MVRSPAARSAWRTVTRGWTGGRFRVLSHVLAGRGRTRGLGSISRLSRPPLPHLHLQLHFRMAIAAGLRGADREASVAARRCGPGAPEPPLQQLPPGRGLGWGAPPPSPSETKADGKLDGHWMDTGWRSDGNEDGS